MSDIRQRHTAEYDYPGSFFPESMSRSIPAPTLGAAVAAQKDDAWYAVTIYTITEKRFESADGEKAWVRQGDVEKVGKFVIGTMVHYSDVPTPVDENGRDTDILISNIRNNSEDGYGVKTRRGNWQIASDYDRVLTVEQLEMEKP